MKSLTELKRRNNRKEKRKEADLLAEQGKSYCKPPFSELAEYLQVTPPKTGSPWEWIWHTHQSEFVKIFKNRKF